MADNTRKVSFTFAGGVDEQSAEELRAPVIQPGTAITLASSVNTRLSKVKGTCIRSPDVESVYTAAASTVGHALVPSKVGLRTMLMADPAAGGQVIVADGDVATGSGVAGAPYDDYGWDARTFSFPTAITRAGAVGPSQAFGAVSSIYDSTAEVVWFGYSSADNRLFLAALDPATGSWVIPEFSFANDRGTKVGLTRSGTTNYVWYARSGRVYFRSFAMPVSGNEPTLGSELGPIWTDLEPTFWDVCSGPSGYAYLVGRANGLSLVLTYVRVNLSTGALDQTATYANFACTDLAHCSVAWRAFSSVDYVVMAWSTSADGGSNYAIRNATTNAAIGSSLLPTTAVGRVSAGFAVLPAASSPSGNVWVVAVSQTDQIFSAASGLDTIADTNYTGFYIGSLASATATIDALDMPWFTMHSQLGTIPDGAYEYPCLVVCRELSVYSEGDVGGDDYLADPAMQLVMVRGTRGVGVEVGLAAPIARFGMVRGVAAPAFARSTGSLPVGGIPRNGSKLYLSYRKADLSSVGVDPGPPFAYPTEPPMSVRYVELDTAASQPSVVLDREGPALVAGALPLYWDGSRITELGATLHIPCLKVDTNPLVGGPVPAIGTYVLRTMHIWRDMAGLLHRTAPSAPFAIDCDGATEVAHAIVTPPVSLQNAAHTYGLETQVYMTLVGTTEPYYLADTTVSSTDGSLMMQVTPPTAVSAQIYSLGTVGEELPPQPPPPLLDMAVVQGRVWGIDAEYRNRLVASKLRTAGVSVEFHPALEVILPNGSGDAVACRELNGMLVVFTTNSIWIVDGSGPNNTGTNGGFSQPSKISDVGCVSRHAVLSTPVGIVFQDASSRFSVLQGAGQPVRMPGVAPGATVTGAFLLEEADEACFVVDDEVKVYNYDAGRWTSWTLPAAPTLVVQSAVDRNTALLYAQSTGRIYRIASNTFSETSDMSWSTDWILLGGDFQDRVLLRDVVISARRGTAHAVQVDVYTNYGTSATTSRTWSVGDINSLVEGDRYTIRLEPVRQDTRAVKIAVTETASAVVGDRTGMRPLACTLVYDVTDMLHQEAFLAGSHK